MIFIRLFLLLSFSLVVMGDLFALTVIIHKLNGQVEARTNYEKDFREGPVNMALAQALVAKGVRKAYVYEVGDNSGRQARFGVSRVVWSSKGVLVAQNVLRGQVQIFEKGSQLYKDYVLKLRTQHNSPKKTLATSQKVLRSGTFLTGFGIAACAVAAYMGMF